MTSKMKKKKTNEHPMQQLFEYGQAYRSLIWKAVTCSIINKIFNLAPPVLYQFRFSNPSYHLEEAEGRRVFKF